MQKNEIFNKKNSLKILQSLYLKKKGDYSFDFGKNLTVVIGQEFKDNNSILELFLKSFHLNDPVIVNNLRNVSFFFR